MKADVMNMPYRKLGDYQFTLRGCGIIVGYALGIYADMQKTAELFRAEDERVTVEPNPENSEAYKPYYNAFKKAFSSSLDETMRRLCSAAVE